MKYQAYPEYKDSGIKWLGVIPNHWVLTRIKFIARCLDGARIPLNAQERSVMQGDVPYWGANNVVDYVNDFIFDEELILLGEDGAPFFDKTKEVAFNVSGKIWPNNHVHVLRPDNKKIEFRFMKYALNCADFHLYISGSTRDKLNQSDMNEIYIRSCELFEQQQIASFLDHETAKIDTLIEKQQQLIKLLKEKRQAVISHAVTKGLNPNAPMRDSGVEWLGEVPEHWISCTLRRYADFVDGDRGSEYPNEKDFKSDGVLFLSSKNISEEKLDLTEVKFISQKKFDALNRGKVLDGDLIVKVRGSVGRIGELAIFETAEHGYDTAFINAQMMIIRTREGLLIKYLRFMSQSLYWTEQLAVGAYGTAQQQLSNDVFSNLYMVVPPKQEQTLIIDKLEQDLIIFNGLISKANQAIGLIQERRTALISAAVTGKIDVRNYQATGV